MPVDTSWLRWNTEYYLIKINKRAIKATSSKYPSVKHNTSPSHWDVQQAHLLRNLHSMSMTYKHANLKDQDLFSSKVRYI